MNYFEIILAAMNALVEGLCRHRNLPRRGAMKMAATYLQSMRDEWFSGETPNIAYEDPLCRFAYLYCHTAVNANLCEYAIRKSEDLSRHIQSTLDSTGELRVCAFGGGPGTELLALAKHLCKTREGHPQGDISFTLLDIVEEWCESWNTLETTIKDRLREQFGARNRWPFTISKTFLSFDMTRIEQFANLHQVFTHDLYVMNYVLSEVFGDNAAFAHLIERMAQSAPSGSMFLVVDRSQDEIIDWATRHLRNAGLEVGELHRTSRNMDLDEQSEVLGEYVGLIGRRPRVQWKGAFWITGRKP
jgi:hypothetical protein